MVDYSSLSLADRILSDASDDWLSLAWIFGCVHQYGVALQDSVAKVIARGVIASLLLDGYIVIGELGDDGVIPWETSTAGAIDRLLAEVARTDIDESAEHETWIDLTPKGVARVATWA